jgi:signal peptidase I
MDEQSNQTPVSVPPPTATPAKEKWKDTLSTLGIIILAPIVAFILTVFVFQSYQVDGPSMETTLQDRDRLIVFKTGKTWSEITRSDYIPKRYEIVIFNHTGEYEGGQYVTEKQLIKRVIGLPGDRVVVQNGEVKVYNDENPDGFLVDQEGPEKDNIGGSTSGNINETVGEGEVYVMGDNRGNSLDSRSFGPVKSDDVIGKLSFRIYPFDKIERF